MPGSRPLQKTCARKYEQTANNLRKYIIVISQNLSARSSIYKGPDLKSDCMLPCPYGWHIEVTAAWSYLELFYFKTLFNKSSYPLMASYLTFSELIASKCFRAHAIFAFSIFLSSRLSRLPFVSATKYMCFTSPS